VIDAARLAPSDRKVDAQVAVAMALISESREAGNCKDPIATLNAVNQVQGAMSSRLAPYRARSEATEASRLVGSAQILGQQDVADFEAQQRRGQGGPSGSSLGGPGGMVLGGIVIEQLLRRGRRGFRGGFRGGGC